MDEENESGMDQREEEMIFGIAAKTVAVLTKDEWAYMANKLGVDLDQMSRVVAAVTEEENGSE